MSSWIENKKIITKVYKQLRKQSNGSFIAKHNWTCCTTCGWAEIPDGPNIVFYHMQDTDSAKISNNIYLSWSGNAEKIISEFEKHNVQIEWNGLETNKIKINFNYKN